MNPASLIAGLFRFDFEAILSDPEQLGAFLDLALMIAEHQPRAQDAAERLGLSGKEIPGKVVVRREGNRFVESARVRELLLECPAYRLPALMEVIAKMLGNVSEGRWQTLCEAAGRPDADKGVSQCGTTVFLRKQGSNNQPIERED
jgi:hypothetical protein